MTRTRGVSAILALSALAAGCAVRSAPPWVVAGAQPIAAAQQEAADRLFGPVASRSSKVTIAAAQRPPVPHAGLQLPRVSPDGRWIAALVPLADKASPYDASSLIDGDGLDAVGLVVRAIDGQTPQHVVASPGPCWPVWMSDHQLLFVSYDARGLCAMVTFDVRSGAAQRKSLGLRHMLAPAPHPDGRRVAVCGWGNLPDKMVIFIADLDTLQLHPGPPADEAGGAQLFPRWIDNDTLLYVELGQERGRLMRWTLGDRDAHEMATLAAPPSVFDAHHMLGGITDPLSPGLAYYASYLPAHDAIVLTHLDTGSSIVTRRTTRAGAWWSDDWFIGSRDDRVELVRVDADVDAPAPHTLSLLDGRWAPIWSDAAAKSLILVGPGAEPAQLNVMQLWLVVE